MTVKDLIEYLETHFKLDQRLCFYDEGGAWCELVHVPKSLIGDWMFRYVKDKMESELSRCTEEHKPYVEEEFRFVKPDDMVIY